MNRGLVSAKHLVRVRRLREQREAATRTDMHRRVEGGVFAAAAALGRHLVGELVVDGDLVAVGDLLQGEGERDGANLLVVDDTGRDFREGVPDLVGENAGVEFANKFGGVGRFYVLCLTG